jgi:hypothetical protein
MTAVIYYSYSGHTKTAAEDKARVLGADLIEVTMKKPFGKLSVFLIGCPKAMGRKPVPIDIDGDAGKYDKFAVFMPVWAGHPAPPFNALLKELPKNAVIDLFLVSAGGKTATEDATKAFITKMGFTLMSYTNIKA